MTLEEFLLARVDSDKTLPESALDAVRAITTGWSDPFGHLDATQVDAARAEKRRVLLRLARIWQFHPDFREEWASPDAILGASMEGPTA